MSNNPARDAVRRRWPDFVSVGLFSAAISILMLTGSIYMLQVYDRVLVSQSVETLVALTLIALAAFALQGFLDGFRVRILSRIGALIDDDLSPLALRAATLLPLRGASPGQSMQPVSDTDTLRTFLSGTGPTALFDLPFMPIFLVACFLLSPWLGWFAVAGALVLVALTWLTESRTRKPTEEAVASSMRRQVYADAARRHAEVVDVLGMRGVTVSRWTEMSVGFRASILAASDAQSGFGALARVFRIVLQSAVLGLGAFLVLEGQITGGAMIAASILTSRALAPIETAISHWRGFVAARQAYGRLQSSLAGIDTTVALSLPPPQKSLTVEDVAIVAPGQQEPILAGASLKLSAGDGLAIIGPSGSGKSSLARAIVGIWKPTKGSVRLDGAALDQWDRDALGKHIGYLPQELALFDGTVAETIARFQPDATAEDVLKAAKAAGAHEMIIALPDGYSTRIGDGGAVLSGGQRQRVGLARALFGDPFLVVLDEPNSNLDSDGDEALARAVRGVRDRGGIAIVVTHRPAGLTAVDRVALVMDRQIKLEGPKTDVLQSIARMAQERRQQQQPVTIQQPLAQQGADNA